MKLCRLNHCTGCMVCSAVCSQKAIQFYPDSEGFLYPRIIESMCIDCGKCSRACPQLNRGAQGDNYEKKVYGAWLKNKNLRRKSTSGGAFSAFALEFLSKGNVVFGAGFDENRQVVHKRITKRSELEELRGSKYVQSYIGNTFSLVKTDLEAKKMVLFVGTPCQVDGLYSFLGKRYADRLFTIDLVCHGVPSPLIYKQYLVYLNKQYDSTIQRVYFRDKTPGWYVFGMRVLFANGFEYKKSTYEDPYIRGFLRNLFLRPSCHNCQYANTQRIADITLADFWGYKSRNDKDFDDDKGISMIMLNNKNGENAFESVKSDLLYWERSLEEAVNGNPALSQAFPPAENRDQFWKDYQTLSFDDLVDKYMFPEKEPDWVANRNRAIAYHYQYRMVNRKDRIKHLPNRFAKRALGKKYEKIKELIKK